MGRRWHFFFAWLFVFNGLAYLAWSLVQRPSPPRPRADGQDLKHIGASILEHARLKFPKGDEAKRYNVLQKLDLSHRRAGASAADADRPGLAMSPGMDAAFPFLLDMLGGTADGAHHPFHLGELASCSSSSCISSWC